MLKQKQLWLNITLLSIRSLFFWITCSFIKIKIVCLEN